MVTMEHPNGCVHNVEDAFVEKFIKAGWKIKAAEKQPSSTEQKKRKAKK